MGVLYRIYVIEMHGLFEHEAIDKCFPYLAEYFPYKVFVYLLTARSGENYIDFHNVLRETQCLHQLISFSSRGFQNSYLNNQGATRTRKAIGYLTIGKYTITIRPEDHVLLLTLSMVLFCSFTRIGVLCFHVGYNRFSQTSVRRRCCSQLKRFFIRGYEVEKWPPTCL